VLHDPKESKGRKDAKAKDGKGKERKTEWKAKETGKAGTPKIVETKPKENGKSTSKAQEGKEKGKGAGKASVGKGKQNLQDLGTELTTALVGNTAPPKAQGAPGFAGAAANGFRKRMVWADVDSNCSTPPNGSPAMPYTRPRANPVSKTNGPYSNQSAGAKWNVNPKYGPTGSVSNATPAKITPVETPKWKIEAKYGMSAPTPTKKAAPAVELGKAADESASKSDGLHPTLAAHQAATAKLIAELMGKD
jgi:hypothetical protein